MQEKEIRRQLRDALVMVGEGSRQAVKGLVGLFVCWKWGSRGRADARQLEVVLQLVKHRFVGGLVRARLGTS